MDFVYNYALTCFGVLEPIHWLQFIHCLHTAVLGEYILTRILVMSTQKIFIFMAR